MYSTNFVNTHCLLILNKVVFLFTVIKLKIRRISRAAALVGYNIFTYNMFVYYIHIYVKFANSEDF